MTTTVVLVIVGIAHLVTSTSSWSIMQYKHYVFLFSEDSIVNAMLLNLNAPSHTNSRHGLDPSEVLESNAFDSVEAFLINLNDDKDILVTRKTFIDAVTRESGSFPFVYNECLFVPCSLGTSCAMVPERIYNSYDNKFETILVEAMRTIPNRSNLLNVKPKLQLVKSL